MKRIFAHRGYWYPNLVPNSLTAIQKAFEMGFSIETDIRDQNRKVVISHDPVDAPEGVLSLQKLIASRADENLILALNVKADGLLSLIEEPIPSAFFFDMSAPEARKFHSDNREIALRLSDLEPLVIPTQTPARWLWLDSFVHDWFIEAELPDLSNFAGVVVVSPELHGRGKDDVWSWLSSRWSAFPNLCVCTDFPEEFARFLEN